MERFDDEALALRPMPPVGPGNPVWEQAAKELASFKDAILNKGYVLSVDTLGRCVIRSPRGATVFTTKGMHGVFAVIAALRVDRSEAHAAARDIAQRDAELAAERLDDGGVE